MSQLAKTDDQWASEGSYLIYASPWSKFYDSTLVEGRDYSNTITYQVGQLPNRVQMTWKWPTLEKRKTGVCGFNHIGYGNYVGGAVKTPIPSRQIKNILNFTTSYGIDVSASPSSFNGLFEFFLTNTSGNSGDRAIEIGWYWYAPTPTMSWAKTGIQYGICTDKSGKQWTVSKQGTFVTFVPVGGNLTWGTIDIKTGLDFLISKGVINGDLWFNGCGIGIEPLGLIGTAYINSWKVDIS